MESTSSCFMMDETPTPTKFIRNCEEVGLFQDLQHINPFEETFRIAAESSSKNSVISIKDSTDDKAPNSDTLNTPSVIPTSSYKYIVDHSTISDTVNNGSKSVMKCFDKNASPSFGSRVEVQRMEFVNDITVQPICLLDLSLTEDIVNQNPTTVINVHNASTEHNGTAETTTTHGERLVASFSMSNIQQNVSHVITLDNEVVLHTFPVVDLSDKTRKLRKLLPAKTSSPRNHCISVKEKIRQKLVEKIQISDPETVKVNSPVLQQTEETDHRTTSRDENFDIRSRNRAAQRRYRNRKNKSTERLKCLLQTVVQRNKDLQKEITKEKESNALLKSLLLKSRAVDLSIEPTTIPS